MDDGYWAALLRDVEEEPDAGRERRRRRKWSRWRGERKTLGRHGRFGQRGGLATCGGPARQREAAEVRISGFNRGGLARRLRRLTGLHPGLAPNCAITRAITRAAGGRVSRADQRDAQRARGGDRSQPLSPDPV